MKQLISLILFLVALSAHAVTVQNVQVSTEVTLEVTVYRPPGDGPFPLVVMNHGKALGHPKLQPRVTYPILAAEFVKRGYAVIVPMRRGFANSTGVYQESCDLITTGLSQAEDVRLVLDHYVRQPWVDASRVIVAGQSYGGLTAVAFAATPYPGVRGVINVAGGLRFFGGCDWRTALITAFGAFGQTTSVPELWLYGANDGHFDHAVASSLYTAFVANGPAPVDLVLFGPFRSDAHGVLNWEDGVEVWWPPTEAFLKRLGLPVSIVGQ